ncbi:T-cell surface glycoprotein CD1a-like [Lycaon pictus]
MLFLQLVLLVVLLPEGDSEDAFQEPVSFQVILTTSFYNSSWTQNLASAWLDELQTHSWDSDSGTFLFLWPWAKGKLSKEELIERERTFHTFSIRFPLIFQDSVSDWQLEYPFQVQMAEGCGLYFGEPSVGFMQIAYQGSDLYNVVNLRIHSHINDFCPHYLLGLLDAGKADLQRQVRPEAWLSAGPSPGPGHLQLVCHVSGFYPKPVWVTWMRSEQEQQDTQLPHADGMWYRQVSLDVKVKETAGLSCWCVLSPPATCALPP